MTLSEGEEAIAGRGSYARIVIKDSKASRRHARFHCKDGDLMLEDLDSINGVYVNGARIQSKSLFPGDKVEIANLRIRIEMTKNSPAYETVFSGVTAPALGTTSGNVLATDLSTTRLTEALRFLVATKKTGELIVHAAWGSGRIYLEFGEIRGASIDGRPEISAAKAIERLCRTQSGSTEFNPDGDAPPGHSASFSIEAIENTAAEFDRQFESIERLLPAPEAKLSISGDPASRSESERAIARLVDERGSIAGVMDNYDGSDAEALSLLVDLLKDGIVTAQK